ncbi:hypothetical protein COCC4DRAFT_29401 [Bipolaris maydis ATCC 48331]|uniref:Uncharacterized protein n=2 Tax=Cochliobolus heterostrophus TaxID=5016 RepID=M2V7Z4_COCH5|nr:uncharacterized protein COCC4DRAFT_29401 [Bipolaris maydis ATCC 48331]EMD95843.1 hypothetical protein COCHEDRAFT_1019412 [Bipolaris maydis C5]ENI10703.1 hypothetical protein COCC4DRAFT_29401 [Bipolaris maydis ATCC 48331]
MATEDSLHLCCPAPDQNSYPISLVITISENQSPLQFNPPCSSSFSILFTYNISLPTL